IGTGNQQDETCCTNKQPQLWPRILHHHLMHQGTCTSYALITVRVLLLKLAGESLDFCPCLCGCNVGFEPRDHAQRMTLSIWMIQHVRNPQITIRRRLDLTCYEWRRKMKVIWHYAHNCI